MLLSVAVPTAVRRASSPRVAAQPAAVNVAHSASAPKPAALDPPVLINPPVLMDPHRASAPLVTVVAESAVKGLTAVNVETARANSKGVSFSSPFIYQLSSSSTALHRHRHRHLRV